MIITLPLSVWMLTSYFKAIPRRARRGGDHRRRLAPRRPLPHHAAALAARASSRSSSTPSSPPGTSSSSRSASPPTRSVKTLPIGLAEFSTEFNTDWGAVMAASVVMTLPIALLFLVHAAALRRRPDRRRAPRDDDAPGPHPIPAARPRHLRPHRRRRPGGDPRPRSSSATAISTRPRATAPRRNVGEAIRRSRPAARRGLRHHQGRRHQPRPRRTSRRASGGASTALGVDQVDLLLIHWPSAARRGAARGLLTALAEAQARGPGPADRRLQLHDRATSSAPRGHPREEAALATNQVEIHPYLQAPKLRDYGAASAALPLTAYEPLVGGGVIGDPVLERVGGEARGAARRRWTLAFLMAEGHAVIPASSQRAHLPRTSTARRT